MKAIRNPRLHADALVAGEAVNDINEVESVWFLGPGLLKPIYRGEIDEVIEILLEFQICEQRNDSFGCRDYEILT